MPPVIESTGLMSQIKKHAHTSMMESMMESMISREGTFYPNIMKFLVTSPQPSKRKLGLTSFPITVYPS